MEKRKSRASLPKPKGGGRPSKRKAPGRKKAKDKTAVQGAERSQQKMLNNEAPGSVESPITSNKGTEEATPSSLADVVEADTTHAIRESIEATK